MSPCDIYHVQKSYTDDGFLCSLKSSMDPEVVHCGRSFGGVGFICKKLNNISYKSIDIDCKRISVIQLCNANKAILTIIGVYMPFYNGSHEQVEQYLEMIDLLQSVLDSYAQEMPVMIVGDFNASLPQQALLNVNWYRQRPFNKHSVLLYEFMSENSLIVSNFSFTQSIILMRRAIQGHVLTIFL